MSKFYLKKSYVNAHICVDDYHENVKNEEKLKQKIKFTDNATIVSRDVKETRSTIEEITEKEYNKKIGRILVKKLPRINSSPKKLDIRSVTTSLPSIF